jgi:nucleotide-binding universal stress UspA family protein
VEAEFERRCQGAGIAGKLAVEVGGIARKICERNRWTDLVVVNITYPPPLSPVARLTSGSRAVLRRCASPILTVPEAASPLDRALLAYDGSRRAEEALFVAAYLAGRWNISLAVVSVVGGGRVTPDTLAQAQQYLAAQGVQATFIQEGGSAADAILNTAQQQASNFVIMGGYGYSPVLEVMLGSTVDQVLRAGRLPTLICR